MSLFSSLSLKWGGGALSSTGSFFVTAAQKGSRHFPHELLVNIIFMYTFFTDFDRQQTSCAAVRGAEFDSLIGR